MADNKELKRLADHVAVLNEEMGEVQVDIAGIKVNLDWLRKIAWWQLGLLGSLLLGSVGYVLFS